LSKLMESTTRSSIVFGTQPGIGGLGQSVSAAITALSANDGEDIFALGPKPRQHTWSLPGDVPDVQWIDYSAGLTKWRTRYTWLRWRTGRLVFLTDRRLGRWAAEQLLRIKPQSCYLFTQVALETLRWARNEGIQTVIDNPNGHIRNFWKVCERESQYWFGKSFHGHPSKEMIERVEEEYRLADRIRVYSHWGRASMQSYGVPEDKIQILQQTTNLERFRPAAQAGGSDGPLRVCYVGSLDLRKGFAHLLRAIRMVGARHIALRIAGATGDRDCARLFARESEGLQVECAPTESLSVYQQSEVLAVPTLEDGLPFVLVEGLACGLPAVVTTEAGAAECVRDKQSGWIVSPGNAEEIASALENALMRRKELGDMGRQARRDVEKYAGPAQLRQLSEWFHQPRLTGVSS
jgi:glycosyltransferase involved in cell wall biosynthesis